MMAFQTSDTWVMLALLRTASPAGISLRSLIATADYINHAIPTYEELAGGLARLMRAGYVEKQAGQFCATSTIRSFYTRITTPRRSIWKDWQDVAHFLQTHEVTSPIGLLTPSRVVSRATYERAVRAYTSSI